MVKSGYDWFWVGKNPKIRIAVEEYLKILEMRTKTRKEIALDYGVSEVSISNNIKQLVEQKLVKDTFTIKFYNRIITNENKCMVCKKNLATQIHHLSYKPVLVINICETCHSIIHRKQTPLHKLNNDNSEPHKPKPLIKQFLAHLEMPFSKDITTGKANREYDRLYKRLIYYYKKQIKLNEKFTLNDFLEYAKSIGIKERSPS